ncbi:hypothetical protein LTR53_003351 [Teratosphaeriaceae sp. CCFEE 6253]|nr:hypothetical protein LTR53_003351 [Teratosphaeriaceae sp. CCFEE 6253]
MYRPQDTSAGAGNHHSFLSASTPSSSFSQTQFPSPLFALDPSLQNSPQLLHPHGPPRQQTPDRRTLNDVHGSMLPPTSVSPRLQRSTPHNTAPASYRPQDRSLPSQQVTQSNITDGYVSFILYCNPHFALNVDAETLRTSFNNSPKSDSKEFETYRLWELIRQFDAKEIKTWGQLALDLGVEAPDVSKGQSVQKVQQYTVRLKRWMHAMHIDAFFEYLLGKEHSYFTNLPPPSDPIPEEGRDGVLAEEDLAIRALDPSFRPKRGRRRNPDAEGDEDGEDGSTKKRKLDVGEQFHGLGLSAFPQSAHPGGNNDPWAIASAVTPQTFAPWANRPNDTQSAVTATGPSHLRWQLRDEARHVATPHPMTAQPTSMAAHIEAAFEGEPKSAIAPAARRRRKHGPAVSSAWPSSSAPGSKPRGRPPANRSAQDGPFTPTPDASIVSERSSESVPQTAKRPAPTSRQSDGSRPAKRLSLQVPQHTGGPVRLATPPPRVLLNGETNDSEGQSSTYTPSIEQAPSLPAGLLSQQRVASNRQSTDRELPGFAYEVLKRVLTNDLLRATVVGRKQRLNGDEAKRLADAVLQRMGIPKEDTEQPHDDIARLTAASWLGLGEQLNVPLGPATSHGKHINVARFRVDRDGYEEIVSAQADTAEEIREVFDLSWTVSMAGCNGAFEMKGLTLATLPPLLDDDSHDAMLRKAMVIAKQLGISGEVALKQSMLAVAGLERGGDADLREDQIDWKARCLAMEFGGQMARGELKRIKNHLLEQMLDIILWTGD